MNQIIEYKLSIVALYALFSNDLNVKVSDTTKDG